MAEIASISEAPAKLGDDPRGLLAFRPGADGAWDVAAAAHLARRAGFGAPLERVNDVLARGPLQAFDVFLEEAPATRIDSERIRESARALGSHEAARSYWVH